MTSFDLDSDFNPRPTGSVTAPLCSQDDERCDNGDTDDRCDIEGTDEEVQDVTILLKAVLRPKPRRKPPNVPFLKVLSVSLWT